MTTKDLNFWLNEKELKTPKHDEMVLWCFNNIEKIRKDLNILNEVEITTKFWSKETFNWNWAKEEVIVINRYGRELGEREEEEKKSILEFVRGWLNANSR